MFADSPYAVPVGSFQRPVPVPSVPATDGTVRYMAINCEWLPYVVGALKQLVLQSTWDTNDPDELTKVQGWAMDLISQFNCATAPTLTQLNPPPHGAEMEDFMPLRVDCDCNVFVTCCDGTEKQILTSDQVKAISRGQPGGGAPLPASGGGCQSYDLTLPGNGLRLVPPPVSTGDTITISGVEGVTYDGDDLHWYCPDGSIFFATCTGVTHTVSTDPLNTVAHMKLIAKIGTTFYDVGFNTPFTVPSGHSNDQVHFQVNDDSLTDDSGELSFIVEVCNNQTGVWTSILDFRSRTYPFVDASLGGVYVPGVGYQGTNKDSLDLSVVQLHIALGGSFLIDQMSQVYTTPGQSGTNGLVGFETNSGFWGSPATPGAQTNAVFSNSIPSTSATDIYADNNVGTHSGDAFIYQWVIQGHGPKPSFLP